jgi:hypothetical protein
MVRGLLESRFHAVSSGTLLVLTYRGRRSGRTFSIPLRYAELPDGRLVALAVGPAQKLWWRSFRTPREAVLTLRGEHVAVVGAVVEGHQRAAARGGYEARYPRSARLLEGAALVVFARAG